MTFDVLRALVRRGVGFKIVGGVAFDLLGLPRAVWEREAVERARLEVP